MVGSDKSQMYCLSLCNESAFKLQRHKVKHIFLTSIKNISVFQVSALINLGMVGLHYYFILLKYFILILLFTLYFPHFHIFSIFDNCFLKIHNKMFRIGVKTYVGSGNLKHTYLFLALRISIKFFLVTCTYVSVCIM